MDLIEEHLIAAGAAEVAFAECRDEARQLLPKIICFAHHAESMNLPDFIHQLPKIKYIDIGLQQMVKTTLDVKSRETAQVKQ